MKDGGSNEDLNDHLPSGADFIKELLGESFKNYNPHRDIFNVTLTLPLETKEDLTRYIKANGKAPLVKAIVREVRRCQSAEVK